MVDNPDTCKLFHLCMVRIFGDQRYMICLVVLVYHSHNVLCVQLVLEQQYQLNLVLVADILNSTKSELNEKE